MSIWQQTSTSEVFWVIFNLVQYASVIANFVIVKVLFL